MDSVVEIENLEYATPLGRPLQRSLNVSLKAGQMLLLSGSNGCGKSTLLKLLMQEQAVYQGKLQCRIPLLNTEYLPQLENTEVHLPLLLKDVLSISQDGKISKETIQEIGLLTNTQLNSAWNTASGGERKRALLTRALIRNPSLLVLDEPMNHLDQVSRSIMSRALSNFLKKSTLDSPRAVVMVCHQGLEEDEEALFKTVKLNLDETRVGSET